MEELQVESLDQEGRGVARRDGKAVFIEGALVYERGRDRTPSDFELGQTYREGAP